MKIRKAEQHEKNNYRGLHSLFGHVIVTGVLNGVKSKWCCTVEYLGEGKGEPNYEVIAPTGMHFAPDRVHTVLGVSQRDLLDQLAGSDLEVCTDKC